MNKLLGLSVLTLACFSSVLTLQDQISNHNEVVDQFHKFMEEYERSYNSKEEYYLRLAIFQENLRRFQEHNSNPESTFTMGITPFADRRPGDVLGNLKPINAKHGLRLPQKRVKETSNLEELEMTIDWTTQGVVPPVVDGGDLSDGVNYMIAYSIDSAHAIKLGGKMVEYSVRELSDCTQDMQSAIEFTLSKGLETSEDYNTSSGQFELIARSGCQYDPLKKQIRIKEWDTLTTDENIVLKMTDQLAHQPIVTVMNAESGEFLYYTGGVLSQGCTSQVILNHSLMVVGYDEQGDYWKLQNSWGTSWGENGFVRIKRNENVCGVETTVFFPVPY